MTETPEEIKFKKLKNFNIAMGFLHMIQGGLILWLSNGFSLPVNNTLLHYNAASQTIGSVTDTLGNLPLGPMIA